MANITAVVLDPLVLWNQTEPMDGCLGSYAFSVIQRLYIYWGLGLGLMMKQFLQSHVIWVVQLIDGYTSARMVTQKPHIVHGQSLFV